MNSQSSAGSQHLARQQILVVDQDQVAAVNLANQLSTLGYEAIAVQGGVAAIKAIGQVEFQLVITELQMQDVDGFELIQHLHENHRDIAIIALTGCGSVESAIKAIHLHVEDFFVKPIDFSELKKAIERVFLEQEKETHRQNLIETVAHDIKAPLTSILGFSQILVEKDGGLNKNFNRYTEIIQSNSRKILHLIDNYLLNSRLQEGEMEALFTALDPVAVIQCEIDALQYEIDQKKLSICFDSNARIGSIQADEHLLSRAIANLLGNAVKYTPRGEIINLSIDKTESVVEIRVSNKGGVLCPGDEDSIFQPYQRGGNHRRVPGVGLGLHIVRAIARAHGGSVRCQTQGDEVSFILSLPVKDAVE